MYSLGHALEKFKTFKVEIFHDDEINGIEEKIINIRT